jgi:hypothetical protein
MATASAYRTRVERARSIRADLEALCAGTDPTVRDELPHMATDLLDDLIEAAGWWFNGEFRSCVPKLRRARLAHAIEQGDADTATRIVRETLYDAWVELFENTSCPSARDGRVDLALQGDNAGDLEAFVTIGRVALEQVDPTDYYLPDGDGPDVDHGVDVLTWADIARAEASA